MCQVKKATKASSQAFSRIQALAEKYLSTDCINSLKSLDHVSGTLDQGYVKMISDSKIVHHWNGDE